MDFINHWKTYKLPGISFLMVVNNIRSKDLLNILSEYKYIVSPGDFKIFEVAPVDSAQSVWSNLTLAQNLIRDYCLAGRFTHLFFNECSRPCPPEVLNTLLRSNKQVIGALYKDTYQLGYYCVYEFDQDNNIHKMKKFLRIDEYKEPMEVDGIGFGATLIETHVLELISGFRCGLHAADTYFCLDMKKLCIPIYAAPIFVENTRVDRNPARLKKWIDSRNKLLSADKIL